MIRRISTFLLIAIAFITRGSHAAAQTSLLKAEQFYIRSQNDSALKYLQLSESIFNKAGNDSMAMVVKNRMARILIIDNKINSAFTLLKSNHRLIQQKYGELNELMLVCNDLLGDCYMSISDAETAVKHYRYTLAIRSKIYDNGHQKISYSYANIARYHSFKINKDSAYFYSQKGIENFDANAKFNWDIPYERILLEYAYAKKITFLSDKTNPFENMDQIRKLYKEAAMYVGSIYGEKSRQMASIYRLVGNTYTDEVLAPNITGQRREYLFKQANYNYNKSLSIISATKQNENLSKSTLHYVKALVFEYCYLHDSSDQVLYQYDLAIKELAPDYKSNDTLTQKSMKACNFKYDLMTVITTKAFCYYKYQYHKQNIHALKRAYLLLNQSVYLWNQIIHEFEYPYANRLITIYNNKIFDSLTEIAWKLYGLENDSTYLSDIFKFSEQSKTSLQQRLLLNAGIGNLPSLNINATDPSKLQQYFKNNDVLFIDFFGNDFVSAMSKNTFIVHKINNQVSPDLLLNEYNQAMKNNDVKKYQSTTATIFNNYFRPVIDASHFKGDELIIAADGLISHISLSGLVTDTLENANDFRKLEYAGRKYKIRYILSAKSLFNDSISEKSVIDSMGLFVPKFKNHSSLPFNSILVNELKEKIPTRLFLQEKVSAKLFVSEAVKYDIIHLVTHAEGNPSNPGMTRLLFSDQTNEEYYIPVDSIYGLKLKAELAVLSACETNSGYYEYGEGTMNFARAFIYAGAKSTITTQWSVDDRSTASILSEFYNNILSHKSLSSSLQEAQHNYLHKCKTSTEANPMYWSGIILTGANSTIKQKIEFKFDYWISSAVIGILFISGAIVLKRNRYLKKEIPVKSNKK